MPVKRSILAAITILVIAIIAWRLVGPDTDRMATAGAPLVDVAVPALSGEAKAGEALFNANCAACHGANAAGQEGVAPPLVHIIYEPNHHSDAAFHLAAQRGVRAHHWPFGNMAPVDGVGEAEVDRIVTYVRTLQRANGIH